MKPISIGPIGGRQWDMSRATGGWQHDRSIQVIKWLESEQGERWSKQVHNSDGFRTLLVTVVVDGRMSGDPELVLWYA